MSGLCGCRGQHLGSGCRFRDEQRSGGFLVRRRQVLMVSQRETADHEAYRTGRNVAVIFCALAHMRTRDRHISKSESGHLCKCKVL